MTVVDDLVAEQAELESILSGLDPDDWEVPTPAPTWAVRDQVGHLAYSEDIATMALCDPDQFLARKDELIGAIEPADSPPRRRGATASPNELLTWWTGAASGTNAALHGRDPKDRVPWVVDTMSATSFATARLMETWAHGQDIVDALGLDRAATPRLRHIAHLGVSTRPFSYAVRGRTMPDVRVRVELTGPAGERWEWGPDDAADRVAGPALDFCLLVTQRRCLEDVSLTVDGNAAAEWVSIAQAFAGPPTLPNRTPA